MNLTKRIVASVLCGGFGMAALWAAIFVGVPDFAKSVFFWPGIQLIPVVDLILPDAVIRSLWPEGGLIAAAGAGASAAIAVWWLIGVMTAYLWLRARWTKT